MNKKFKKTYLSIMKIIEKYKNNNKRIFMQDNPFLYFIPLTTLNGNNYNRLINLLQLANRIEQNINRKL